MENYCIKYYDTMISLLSSGGPVPMVNGSGNLKGVTPVLYRLPEIIKAKKSGRVVFIVEGEKDVHTLEKHGFCATCNSGGAGKF